MNLKNLKVLQYSIKNPIGDLFDKISKFKWHKTLDASTVITDAILYAVTMLS